MSWQWNAKFNSSLVKTAKGQKVDASQEMIAIGLSNILGSFFSSFAVTGSFSRTAVNAASGVHTALSGVYTGWLHKNALFFFLIVIEFSLN